jgi:hypothetical protein
MPTKNHNTHSSAASTTTTSTAGAAAAAKTRKKARKPPVAERVMVSTPIAPTPPVAPAILPASPPAAPNDAPTPAPAVVGSPSPSPSPSPAPSGASPGGTTADVPVIAPPQVTVPGVPSGFVPAAPADFRGFRPMASEIAAVPDAVAELQGFTDYGTVFGITAPPSGQVAQRLTVAAQWTALLSSSSGWYKYVKSQEGMAWKDALSLVDGLKVPFDLATTASPALLSSYPALARLLGASKVVAKRGVATKKKNAATTAAAAGAAASAPPAATPDAGAGNGAAAANPAAPRVVTVQG